MREVINDLPNKRSF